MKITDVEAIDVVYPLPSAFRSCLFPGHEVTNVEVTIIKIKTDEGIVGYSANRDRWWTDSVIWSKNNPSHSKRVVDMYVKRYLVGKDPFDVEQHMRALIKGLSMFIGSPWFIEFALWDIIGKASGQPIYRLLGGSRNRIKAYCSTAELKTPERVKQQIPSLLDQNFKAIKLRAHHFDYRKDVETVRAAREIGGDEIDIMVDANQSGMPAYGLVPRAEPTPLWDYNTALKAGREFEKMGIYWLEDPLPGTDMEGLSRLREELDIQIAGGETEVGIYRFRELLENRCFDIILPDVALSGGILEVKKIAALAEAHHVTCNPHIWGTAISIAANLQIAGAIPNCSYAEFPHDPPGFPSEARDFILKEPIKVDEAGYVDIPSKPGLGVEINEEVIQKYAVS